MPARSLTSGSSAAGVSDAPISDGPWTIAGAPTPSGTGRAAIRLLVVVGELHVFPDARRLAGVVEGDRLREEADVAGAEPVLRRRHQQPEVEVAGGAELDEAAERPGAVGELTVRLRLD